MATTPYKVYDENFKEISDHPINEAIKRFEEKVDALNEKESHEVSQTALLNQLRKCREELVSVGELSERYLEMIGTLKRDKRSMERQILLLQIEIDYLKGKK